MNDLIYQTVKKVYNNPHRSKSKHIINMRSLSVWRYVDVGSLVEHLLELDVLRECEVHSYVYKSDYSILKINLLGYLKYHEVEIEDTSSLWVLEYILSNPRKSSRNIWRYIKEADAIDSLEKLVGSIVRRKNEYFDDFKYEVYYIDFWALGNARII